MEKDQNIDTENQDTEVNETTSGEHNSDLEQNTAKKMKKLKKLL